MQIDQLDRQILLALEHHARLSNRELARQVGRSESACLDRLRKLERRGVIVGYRTLIAPAALGRTFEAVADVSVADLPQAAVASFEALVGARDEVSRITRVSGHYDFSLYFAAPSLLDWRALCQELDQIGIGPGRVRLGVVVSHLKG